jgi:hypothetical protein
MPQVNLRTSIHRMDNVRITQYCGAFNKTLLPWKNGILFPRYFWASYVVVNGIAIFVFSCTVPIVSDFHQTFDFVDRI